MRCFIERFIVLLFCAVLLINCSSVDKSTSGSRTPEQKLLVAIWEGDIAYIQKALAGGANINRNLKGLSAPGGFDSAAGKSQIVNQNIGGLSYLDVAIIKGNLDIVKLLVTKGAGINDTTNNSMGVSPLMQAVAYQNYPVCEYLVSKGADVNFNMKLGSVLTLAAETGNIEICKLLISKKADVNYKSPDGQTTALMIASFKGHSEVVKLLLGVKGLKINDINAKGATALIQAADMNHTEIIKLIVAKGADVNIKMNNGYTALVFSFARKNVEAVEILCKNGANDFATVKYTLGGYQGSLAAIATVMGGIQGDPDYKKISAIFIKYNKRCITGDCENGKGSAVYATGEKYVGQFKNGKCEGQGTYTWSDKTVYTGGWKEGKLHGKGTLTMSDGRKFVGVYNDGKQGEGKCFDKDNKPINCDGIE